MTNIIMIPLTKLVESEDNVRRASRKSGASELAFSIRSHGLLQSLVVRDTGKGKFAVVAGGRRLRALRMLAKTGDIEKNAPIPCRVIAGDDNAAELSLAENIVRQDLAVHEELEAFQKLVEEGDGPEAIAARFGVSVAHVARRLKLARVSPRLLEALKREEATLDQLAALALTDDHATQEKAFFEAPDWARTPERLKAQIMQQHILETDKLVRFVGVEAYLAEGGAIVTDLFAESEEDSPPRYFENRDLIVRLAAAKLGATAEAVRGEGWAWVEIALDGVAWSQFPERVREQHRVLTAAEEEQREQLYARLDETEDEAEIANIDNAIDALTPTSWNAEEIRLAGAIITLSQSGEPKVERGLVKAEDTKALKALRRKLARAEDAESEDGETLTAAQPKASIPAKLMDELKAHKTLALRLEVAGKPDLALRLLVLALASNALHQFSTCALVRVRIEQADVSRRITRSESTAPLMLAKLTEAQLERLPSSTDALWAFIAEVDQQTLLDLLAVLIAPAIELRPGRGESVADAICGAANLDMSKYWSATPASYFEHVRKDVVIDAIKEINPALDRSKLDKASKAEVLDRAKKTFNASTWLPEPLRAHVPVQAPVDSIAAE